MAPRHLRDRPSIRDVARAAGVSTTTASDALTGRGRYSEETRARVARHAEQLGYRPNPSARNMRWRSTGIVAMMARIESPAAYAPAELEFLTRIAGEISNAAWDFGYFPMLVPPAATTVELDRLPLEAMIVIDPIGDDPLCAALDEREIPYVCARPNQQLRESGRCGWVDNDIRLVTRMVLDRLVRRGEVLMLTTEGQQRYLTEPVDAFRRWVCETGGRGRVVSLPADVSPLRCYDEVLAICSDGGVDVLYIAAEILAGPALQAVHQSGRRVPDDLQVIAASDGLYARTSIPALTCVDLRPDAVGRAAVEIMHAMLTAPSAAPGSRIVDGQIHWRASTLPPAA